MSVSPTIIWLLWQNYCYVYQCKQINNRSIQFFRLYSHFLDYTHNYQLKRRIKEVEICEMLDSNAGMNIIICVQIIVIAELLQMIITWYKNLFFLMRLIRIIFHFWNCEHKYQIYFYQRFWEMRSLKCCQTQSIQYNILLCLFNVK